MSETRDIFYNIFWQNRACRNLFLLSKEELLDTKSINIDVDLQVSVSYPRIIVSNVEKSDEAFQTIKIRTETDKIKKEKSLNDKIQKYHPLISNFLETKFGKSLEKLTNDLNTQPSKFVKLFGKLMLMSESNREKLLIEQLQHYGFIGKNIQTFNELDVNSKHSIQRIIKDNLTEENLWNAFEFFKSVKDIYINSTFEEYYSSNQILVNTLFSNDDFQSRINLFNNLYDAGILSLSNEDSFVECVHCKSGVYRGTFQLQIAPNKLKNLKCPVCSEVVNYYVPFQLHKEIYEIVKSKDGLLLDALINILSQRKIKFKVNQSFLNDIEIDCYYTIANTTYIVESKMFKQNSTREKLNSKLKESLAKLLLDVERLAKNEKIFMNNLVPILLVNIPDQDFLESVKADFKTSYPNSYISKAQIAPIESIKIN